MRLPRFFPIALAVLGFAFAGAAPAAERLLYLSATSATQDQADIALLRTKLKAAGFDAARLQVQRQQVSFEVDAQLREVRRVFAEGPVRLVIATTMDIARTAQLVDASTPIVFIGAADPVLTCLTDTLQRPGRNATGLTTALRAEAKMLEALHDAYPGLTRWVVLVGAEEPDTTACDEHPEPASATPPIEPPCVPGPVARPAPLQREIDVSAVMAIAARLGQPVSFYRLCALRDVDVFAAQAAQRGSTGVIVPLYLLFYQEARALVERLNRARLASVYDRWFMAKLGGLMAVSPRADPAPMATTFDLAIQVLRGVDPANLPVRVPSGFDVWFNLGTARAIGAAPSLRTLVRADRLVD